MSDTPEPRDGRDRRPVRPQGPDGRYICKRLPGDRGVSVAPTPEDAMTWATLDEANRAAFQWGRALNDLGGGAEYTVMHRSVQIIKPHYEPAPPTTEPDPS